MPHSYLKVVGNLGTDVTKAAHAICVRTTMLSLHLIENFLRFQVQDKHNASSFSHMSLERFTSILLQNYKTCRNNKHTMGKLLRLELRFRVSSIDFVFS